MTAHTDAAMRRRHAHRHRIRSGVDIDKAAHGIHMSQTVKAHFATGKPQNPRQYPVAVREFILQCRGVNFASRTASDEHRIFWAPRANLSANDMTPSWRAIAAAMFADTVAGSGHRILLYYFVF